MTFGKRLKKLRSDRGLTQKKLADKLNVTFQTVSKWENDINEPGFSSLKDISKVLNCSIACLFNEEETDVDLLSGGNLLHKNLYDLMRDTYLGVDKIVDKEVNDYCHDVINFILSEACKDAVANGYFKDEKDFRANRLKKNFPFLIYNMPFESNELDYYTIGQFIELYNAEHIAFVYILAETDDIKIIKNKEALIHSIREKLITSNGPFKASQVHGVDQKNIHFVDQTKLYEIIDMVISKKRVCWDKAEKYVLGY